MERPRSSVAERILGKNEATGSNPVVGSKTLWMKGEVGRLQPVRSRFDSGLGLHSCSTLSILIYFSGKEVDSVNTNIATISVEVLNSSHLPLGHTSMARALALILRGAAVVEKADYTREIRSAGNTLAVPLVIRLLKFVDVPFIVAPENFSRLGVLRRDDNTCGYCGERGAPQDMTHDHIVPRSRGGADSWENAITACRPCNSLKADRTPEEAEMPLLFEPTVPYKMYLKSGKTRQKKRNRNKK